MENVLKLIENYVPRDGMEAADRAQMLFYMKSGDRWLTRDDPVAHVTASAWIVDPARTHALMIYHNIYGTWAWTGGHADGDGDLLAVALREANEETGIAARAVKKEPISIESLCVQRHVKRGREVASHLHMNVTFLLEADMGEDIRIKPDENSGVRWIPFDRVEASVTEAVMRPIYHKLMSRAREVK